MADANKVTFKATLTGVSPVAMANYVLARAKEGFTLTRVEYHWNDPVGGYTLIFFRVQARK